MRLTDDGKAVLDFLLVLIDAFEDAARVGRNADVLAKCQLARTQLATQPELQKAVMAQGIVSLLRRPQLNMQLKALLERLQPQGTVQ